MSDFVSRTEALKVACPLCEASPGEACEGSRGNARATVHHDRLNEARRARVGPDRNRAQCEVCDALLDVPSTCAMAVRGECPHGRPAPTVIRADRVQAMIHPAPDPAVEARRAWWLADHVGHYPGCPCAHCQRTVPA